MSNQPNAVALEAAYSHAFGRDRLIPLCSWETIDKNNKPLGKTPAGKDWIKNEYPFADMVAWMERGNNVGFRLGGGWGVLDYDTRRDEAGDALKRLCTDFGIDLGKCFVVMTGGGGCHVYFRIPMDFRGREQIAAYPGIEVKHSARRYVVALGSIHPGDEKAGIPPGRPYTLAAGSPPLDQSPEAPAALLEAYSHLEPPPHERGHGSDTFGNFTAEQLGATLALIPVNHFPSNAEWEPLMMAAHWFSGGTGREEFVAWSLSDPAYTDHEHVIRQRWDSLTPRGNALKSGLIFKTLERLGVPRHQWPTEGASVQFAGEIMSAEELAPHEPRLPDVLPPVKREGVGATGYTNCKVAIQQTGITFGADAFKQRSFVGGHVIGQYAGELNDDAIIMLMDHLSGRFKVDFPTKTVAEAAKAYCMHNRSDSLTDYVEALDWDGEKRMHRFLPDYLGTGDTPYTRAVGIMMLWGLIERALTPGGKFDYMFTLEGEQGKAKSLAIETLVGEDRFGEGRIFSKNEREQAEALAGVWAFEAGELSDYKAPQIETAKAFITRKRDRVRAAYAHFASDNPRRCILFGTTNNAEWLHDETGNRRFIPIPCGEIDIEAIRRDRDQLFAEAKAWRAARRMQTGDYVDADGSHWKSFPVLPPEIVTVAEQEQAARMEDDPRLDLLVNVAGDVERENSGLIERIGVHALYAKLGIDDKFRHAGNGKMLKRLMTRLGWRYCNTYRAINDVQQRSYYRPAPELEGLM